MSLNKNNSVYRAINGLVNLVKEKEGMFAAKQNLFLADAKTYLSTLTRQSFEQEIEKGRNLVLLDLNEQEQAALGKCIGLTVPGNSVAVCLSGKRKNNGRLDYTIYNMPDTSSISSGQGMISAKGAGRVEGVPAPGEEVEMEEVPTYTGVQGYTDFFADQYLTSLVTTTSATAATATEPESNSWYFNQVLNWHCPEGSKHHGITPQPQNTYVSISFTITVYLDSSAQGDFQWIYLSTLGYQSVGSSGMNQDQYHQRGWSNGSMDVVVNDIPGFSLYQNSPTNVNNTTQYTTSVDFSVGVSADQSGGGGSASVDISHSTTENITDWAIKLNDLNNWTFYQNNPWDSRKEKWQGGGMVTYNAAKFRYEVAELPNLSTGVMNFDTMTVWKNNAVSTETVNIGVYLKAYFNYVGLKNTWPAYEGEWWGWYNYTTLNFPIDLSIVS